MADFFRFGAILVGKIFRQPLTEGHNHAPKALVHDRYS